jgi:diadenylate cyclase
MPKGALHDGAVIIRGEQILAAGALLPLAETTISAERFGTRHRAALGITEQTDAVVVLVSEENGQISLVERGRILRGLSESQVERAIRSLLDPSADRRGRLRWSGLFGRPGEVARPAEEEPPTAAARVQR